MIALALSCLLLAAPPAEEPKPPAFSVLKIVKGDDIVFQAMATSEVAALKARKKTEYATSEAQWEKASAAFQAQKGNHGRIFGQPQPEESKVSSAKDALPSLEEAQAMAKDLQAKSDGAYDVVKTTSSEGQVTWSVMLGKKVQAKRDEMAAQYQSRLDSWKKSKQPSSTRPPEPQLEQVKMGFKTKEEAQKALDDLKKAMEKPGR